MIPVFLGEGSACRQGFCLRLVSAAAYDRLSTRSETVQVERLNPADDPPWLYWLDPANIAIGAGRCFLHLDQPDQAAVLLDEGIAQLSDSFVRERQVEITYLADALTRPGKQRDLDAAASLGMHSIDLAESLDSTRGTGLLRELYFRMKPHGELPVVRDFLDQARGLVA